MAVPIQYRKAVQGVLLLSTRPGEIDEVLAEERNGIILSGAHRLCGDAARLAPARPHHRRPHAPPVGGGRERQPQHQGAPRAARALRTAPTRSGQMATAFREMTASLYRRIEASERFAQDVAHELQEPADRRRARPPRRWPTPRRPEQQQELVRQIQEELKRLNKLITDVSNASRLDAELALQETEPVDVRQVLQGVVEVLPRHAEQATRAGSCSTSPRCRTAPSAFVVRAHEARLGRVITNLLDNALSFSPEGGVITVQRPPRRAGDRDRRRRRRARHARRQARGHLQPLLFGSARRPTAPSARTRGWA